jgi:hypothetical protein
MTTPVGKASWAWLTRPQAEDQYGNVNYSITLELDKEGADELCKKVNNCLQEYKKNPPEDAKKIKTVMELDADGDFLQSDGSYKVKFKAVAERTNSKTGKKFTVRGPIKVVDTSGNEVPENIWVTNGSDVAVAFRPNPWVDAKGILSFSFKGLEQVMLVKRVESTGGGSSYAKEEVEVTFGKVPDGFVVSTDTEEEDSY